MGEKINRILIKLIWLFIVALLFYTRFFNLNWGLPYPMHPDERNMVVAIQGLGCQLPTVNFNLPHSIMGKWDIFNWVSVSNFDLNNCFNPHFFAYGQFPIYLGYVLTFLIKFFGTGINPPISFDQGALALRIISATASIFNFFILIKIVKAVFKDGHIFHKPFKSKEIFFEIVLMILSLMFIFVPYSIQLSHFGTTESLLMLFYSITVYLSILYVDGKMKTLSYVVFASLSVGLALATKTSSFIFMATPVAALILGLNTHNIRLPFLYKVFNSFIDILAIVFFSMLFFLIFSPYNFIAWKDFIGSMNYESSVALGSYIPFYTRQFIGASPVLFQFKNIFPYVLGWPVLVTALLGFFALSWKDLKINIVRLALLFYFLPTAYVFAKWTRFMAPIFPLLSLFAALLIMQTYELIVNNEKKTRTLLLIIIFIFTLFAIVPGVAYLSVYANVDTRLQASDWIYKNIPENSHILSETANVVDIPIYDSSVNKSYEITSFDFYNLDNNVDLQKQLSEEIQKSSYIFVPSRRVFANHNPEQFPILSEYYQNLFSGKLGFKKVAEFSSFPKISIFGKTIFEFPDEGAEETDTVFDHPVIRIYKK